MNTRTKFVLSLLAVGALGITAVVTNRHHHAEPAVTQKAKVPDRAATVAKPAKAPRAGTTVADASPTISKAPEVTPVEVVKVKESAELPVQVAPTKRVKEPIQDLNARAALSFVGVDPDAEMYWISAINDPTLSAEERKDLIEDLNEDGLSDPKHPGQEDLPLILNRIQLIEALAPYAMDQVNTDAFKEAYKDLRNMLDGKPVQ